MPKKINVKGPIISNDDKWIYDYFGWDCTTPNDITQGLEEAAGDDVILEINSPGGYVRYGYEMYTAIMQYEGKVTAHVITASSAASLLVCAASEALISDTGYVMIHCARQSTSGNQEDMQQSADALRAVDEGIINAYVRKTGKSREELLAMMMSETYMDPKVAVEYGFIDGYLFGDPNETKDGKADSIAAVAAEVPIIPEDKAKELAMAINTMKGKSEAIAVIQQEPKVAPVQPKKEQNPAEAVSDKTKTEEGNKVKLKELLEQNPEAKAEMEAAINQAANEAKDAERARIQSLDAIAGTVTAEALHDAKYGENPKDGKTLAYEALVSGNKLAESYMKTAIEDNETSGAPDVGTGTPDAGQDQTDEADELAGYVNKGREV